ncbi:M48 family metalloprotease [Nitrincola lacisaponensis]|uniref:M48 family metalloprotease n=1 Tax=Nitrincola lacisaponensis TaxID=267850 RepID=UPI001EF9DD3C|nr:M48 family metalloprotease [Nitrincola lacisaponensis]
MKAILSAVFFSLCTIGLIYPSHSHASTNLPSLADPTSASVSLSSEYRLGRNWARILRGRAPLLQDPITFHYLDELLWDLAPHSQLTDRRLELIVLDNPTFNAFAVPGGIIGVHAGLITAAGSEDELVSVLAHELAHLSQRHYAQRIEEERRNRPLVLAGVLASILIAAADPQGGAAALSGTIGAQAQAQLSFSRRNEEEADRIGMQTLVAANRDPKAMPMMFSRLQRSYRFYGQRPPEFLLSHPVTEARIADSLNRAEALPTVTPRPYTPDFDLIRTRMEVHLSNQPGEILQRFLADSRENSHARSHYGVLLAGIRTGELKLAREALAKLPSSWQQHLYVQLSGIELLLAEHDYTEAQHQSSQLMDLYPGSLPVMKLHARVMHESGRPDRAIPVYRQVLQDYPTDVDSWYQLAEAEGLAGNITGVHEARIEYFLLTGNLDSAVQQITFAKRERNLRPADIARLEQLEAETLEIRRQMKEDF